jgi:hypothetical protein
VSKLLEAIEIVNKVFGTDHDKTCVIANWKEHHIKQLTDAEVVKLLRTCENELKDGDDKVSKVRSKRIIDLIAKTRPSSLTARPKPKGDCGIPQEKL